ncbi:DUF3578 domain-containing protein [Rhizobium sp. EC-SD404]|uniref:MrcB family domain-containing protein n=1 Tax=Rhizobium sp. EC-SD404 TaxID=2038389 RepID=UPI0012598146|nr:DUF3578 domain-containing protein [Rhizobium sp. EC-SD404]VVT31166.1 conserved hypothetical protein [Rhizobium sp. EC-SD404]
MSLAVLTSPEAIEVAIAEFDKIGRARFLEKYGYGSGETYIRTSNGSEYDAEAILAAAVGIQHSERGALRASEFRAAPEAVADKLHELGFSAIDAYDDEDAAITARDIALIASAREKAARGIKYADLDQDERDAYGRVHAALEILGDIVAADLGDADDVSVKLTSGFHPRAGVRGYVPKDLWFAVFPTENAASLAGNPQLFMIVSERGLEYGFGVAVHPNDFSTQSLKDKVREIAPLVFERLPKPNSVEADELGKRIEQSGGWSFRRKHRLGPDQSEFATLSDWLAFLHSPSGKQNAAGGICRYISGSELDSTDLVKTVREMPALFQGLLMRDWHGEHEEAPLLTRSPVAPKSTTPVREFAERLEKFLSVFGQKRKDKFGIEPDLRQAIQSLESWLEEATPVRSRPNIRVNLSVGKGNWTNTPWIALLDRRVTTTTQEGIYVVFLISEDLQVTYLTLIQGMTALVQAFGQKGAAAEMVRVGDAGREQIRTLSVEGFKLDNEIDLRSRGSAKNYELGTIAHFDILTSAIPDDGEIVERLESLLGAYEKIAVDADSKVELSESEDAWPLIAAAPYTIDDALSELFIERTEFERILNIWRSKMNLILQGAPGVGKSYLAKRLAYALIGARAETAIEAVQFHQSYSYEDFVRGFRPDGSGGFELQDGIFLRFVETARLHQSTPFVLIVDEINRGNMSKIFGELMLLIEADKRSPEWGTRLAYPRQEEGRFFIPDNVYVIGMMNTADRSLSLVDYALRRRFAFVTAEPQFEAPGFTQYLRDKSVPDDLIHRIRAHMGVLNESIATDRTNLGPGFRIGHSFFTPRDDVEDPDLWYESVVDTEIVPLLDEYWFDNPDRADEWRDRLRAPVT